MTRGRALRFATLTVSASAISIAACSETSTNIMDDSGDGTSGTPTAGAATGGATTGGAATGGSAGALGGAPTTGGSPSGGASMSGAGGAAGGSGGSSGAVGGGAGGNVAGNGGAGIAGSGGAVVAGSGGAMVAGNGGAGKGGASNGGAGAGGKAGAGAGGGAGKGGAGAGGGAGKGGASGAAGSGGSGGAAPTMGCGATTWPAAGNKTITVGSAMRTFVMYVPTGYDTNRPYPVIFSWHGLTGSQGGFYSLNTTARAGGSALMVSPQGLDNANGDGFGWWNTNDQDLAFVDALITWLGTSYCVDRNRLFSVGFSFGGMFSHLIGCERGNVFRAIAPIAGSFFSYYGGQTPSCDYPVPMIGIHGTADTSVTPASGRNARNVWLTENGCSMTTAPSTPTECVDYQGCMGENAVKWCEHPGTHMVPSFAADAIWNFFRQF